MSHQVGELLVSESGDLNEMDSADIQQLTERLELAQKRFEQHREKAEKAEKSKKRKLDSGGADSSSSTDSNQIEMRSTEGLSMCVQMVPTFLPLTRLVNVISNILDNVNFEVGPDKLSVTAKDSLGTVAIISEITIPESDVYLNNRKEHDFCVNLKSFKEILGMFNGSLDIFQGETDDVITLDWYQRIGERNSHSVQLPLISVDKDNRNPPVPRGNAKYTFQMQVEHFAQVVGSAKRAGADCVRFSVYTCPTSEFVFTNSIGASGSLHVLRVQYTGDSVKNFCEHFASADATPKSNSVYSKLKDAEMSREFAVNLLDTMLKGMRKDATIAVQFLDDTLYNLLNLRYLLSNDNPADFVNLMLMPRADQ
jgi:hypothetical protein